MKGIYVLVIRLNDDTDVSIGKLGKMHFAKGLYAYVGSAQIALEKRVQRHVKKEKKLFWHVDYLLQTPQARIIRVFTKTDGKEGECTVANRIATRSEAIVGFGCSDCSCKSHLFHISDSSLLNGFMQPYNLFSVSASS